MTLFILGGPINRSVVFNSSQTDEWMDIGLPPELSRRMLGGDYGLQCGDQILPLYPGRCDLPDVHYWHVRNLPVHGLAELQIVPMPAPKPALTWTPHPQNANLSGLVPILRVVDTAGVAYSSGPLSTTVDVLEQDNPLRRVVRVRARVPGTPVFMEAHLYVWTDQLAVWSEILIGNQAPNGAVSFFVRSLELATQQPLAWPEWKVLGGSLSQHNGVEWVTNISWGRDLGKAQQLRVFAYQSDGGADHSPRVGVLRRHAIAEYSTFGEIPDVPVPWVGREQQVADRAALDTEDMLDRSGDYYDQRPMGEAKYAGTTGEQEDFGSSQDVYALTLCDPRRMAALQYSADNYFLRPFHNRELDGSPVKYANHPFLRTWSQLPERRVGAQDVLGWPTPLPDVTVLGSDYTGIDDQHRSQEMLTCLMHLTDSYAYRQVCEDFIEMDRAQAMTANGWYDAPRADGRCFEAWADMFGVVPEALGVTLADVAVRRANIAVGATAIYDQHRPMVPLALNADASLTGNLTTPVVSVWQHSIAAKGYYAGWKRTRALVFLALCERACRLVVQHGVQEDAQGNPYLFTSMLWMQGDSLPPQALVPQSTQWGVVSGGEWWNWILPAVLIFAANWPDDPLAPKARRIIGKVWGAGPQTEKAAEWWAVVPPCFPKPGD